VSSFATEDLVIALVRIIAQLPHEKQVLSASCGVLAGILRSSEVRKACNRHGAIRLILDGVQRHAGEGVGSIGESL
jgi:hypothetical protein